MSSERSYLDHNAGSPLRPEVADAMVGALRTAGNPSSVHQEGRRARGMVERARSQVAALVGTAPEQVVFTSGGTEANNLALLGAARLLVSATEHPAILAASGMTEIAQLPVNSDGLADLAELERMLASAAPGTRVALQFANNETGVLQPVQHAADLAHALGATIHCDAVQAGGRIALHLAELGVDSLALSAHKLGGPMGVGALVLASGHELAGHLVAGGGQERGRRGGTENVAGIVGFGVAAEVASRDLAGEAQRLRALRACLESEIRRIAPKAVIFGEAAERLANTVCFAVPGMKAETALIGLDLDGVAVSSGAACSSGKVRRSHVLAAMGVPPELAEGAIRVSLGWNSVEDDVTRFAGALERLVQRLYERGIGRAA